MDNEILMSITIGYINTDVKIRSDPNRVKYKTSLNGEIKETLKG